MDEFERMLFEYLVTISVPGLAPHLGMITLAVAVGVLALAVIAATLLHVIRVLRFRAAPVIRSTPIEVPAPAGRIVRGPARARAPSSPGEFAHA
jgi:hypothetical protein